MPSSLPDPAPIPAFEYDTYAMKSVKISDKLKWTNPRTAGQGARPMLRLFAAFSMNDPFQLTCMPKLMLLHMLQVSYAFKHTHSSEPCIAVRTHCCARSRQ